MSFLTDSRYYQVLGLPRSGTTFMRNVLNNLPDSSCTQELDLIGCVWEQRQPMYEKLWHDLSPWFHKLPAHERDLYAVELMRRLMRSPNASLCGNKDVSVFQEHFTRSDFWLPYGRLITVMRNPYDWVVSYLELAYRKWSSGVVRQTMSPFNRKDFTHLKAYKEAGNPPVSMFTNGRLRDLAHLWRTLNMTIIELAQDERVLHVPYEELYSKPQATFDKVLQFLEHSVTYEELELAIASNTTEKHLKGSPQLGKHKSKLTASQLEDIYEITDVDPVTLT